jgi:hypothetical protein
MFSGRGLGIGAGLEDWRHDRPVDRIGLDPGMNGEGFESLWHEEKYGPFAWFGIADIGISGYMKVKASRFLQNFSRKVARTGEIGCTLYCEQRRNNAEKPGRNSFQRGCQKEN